MGGKKNDAGCLPPFCRSKKKDVVSPVANPRTSTRQPVITEAELEAKITKTEQQLEEAIQKTERTEAAILGRSVDLTDVTLEAEYDALETKQDLDMKEAFESFAKKLYKNETEHKEGKIMVITEAFKYLVDASEDRKRYIELLKKKSDPESKHILDILRVNATNYSRIAYNLKGTPVNFTIKENDIKEGSYDEYIWNNRMRILTLLKTQIKDIRLLHEYTKIIKYIHEKDVLLAAYVSQKGGTLDCIKQFRKVLKKTHITTIPKTHLLKKSDLKKAKVYVVKSPSYDKVTLLKPKDTLDPTVMKWIRVDAKSLKWLENKK